MNYKSNNFKGIFSKNFSRVIETLKRVTAEKKPVFHVFQVPAALSKASYLISKLIVDKYVGEEKRYLSFFGNSRLEGIAGAVKISRHRGRDKYNKDEGYVFVYDKSGDLEKYYNPMNAKPEDALVPGLFYYNDLDQLNSDLNAISPSGLLVIDNNEIRVEDLIRLREICDKNNIIFLLDESYLTRKELGSKQYERRVRPDVVIFSENLLDNQLPFGSFSMSEDVYETWDTDEAFVSHSSTFGNNLLAVDLLRQCITDTEWYTDHRTEIEKIFSDIDSSIDTKAKYMTKYFNPRLTKSLIAMNLHRNVISVHDSVIEIEDSNGEIIRVIDSVAGFGINIRGYCPEDYVSDVLDTHDSNQDYWTTLQKKLLEMTNMGVVFPSVSGALAVGQAIRLGLFANYPKKYVVVFKSGYSGKTLTALIGTVKDIYKEPFKPTYKFVITIDIEDSTCTEQFVKAVTNYDVGLVFFELVQGEAGVRIVSDELLSAIKAYKERQGYLIAIDEIQTGFYRTGGFFLNSQKKNIEPDLITLSKAMSDMSYPIAAVIVNKRVYAQAKAFNPELVAYMEKHYVNQLGAHTSLNLIEKSLHTTLAEDVEKKGQLLRNGLKEAVRGFDFVKEVRGEGLLNALEFDLEKIPEKYCGNIGITYAYICLADKEQPVLLFFTVNNPSVIRYEPPLVITEDQINDIIKNTQRSLLVLKEMLSKENL